MSEHEDNPDAPAWRIAIGARIRQARLDRGLTLRALASDARMYWIELDRYERALQEPNLERLYVLAEILETDIHALIPPSRRSHECGDPVG